MAEILISIFDKREEQGLNWFKQEMQYTVLDL